ncbi:MULTISPECIES: hypothetical protein [Comamonas]|jgi:hypothetical protein|uniref:hypothetical protein n=1 Tax=Comamonas TaxID=283 RepID=UPI001C48FBF2|nr:MULTISPECIES: hypothetical protein [Comamonas]MBV7418507.1 hypothetical protein [Comamonas sp. CMM03]MDH0048169.1 hypothetical protein [Comamonas terrigena]MDH0510577.1 hypothetical protein [Comamonas terrigena]MDH1090516.1 hypothetical protein [Comamonas terrigena]MDH1499281.1 hypothetical protein [Comamonas terrigena]
MESLQSPAGENLWGFLFLSIPLIGNEVINPTDGLFMTDWLLLMAKSIIEKNYLTHAGVKNSYFWGWCPGAIPLSIAHSGQ